MNGPKVTDYDYINFLIGTQKVYSCTEAARVQPDTTQAPAHDALTRLLHRGEANGESLWQEAQNKLS